MKVKTSELSGAALDWAVALAEGHKPPLLRILRGNVALPQEDDPMWCDYLEYSTDPAQAWPIIDREDMAIKPANNGFTGHEQAAAMPAGHMATGPTKLVAAMRCFVASKLGYEIDIPKELL